MLCRFAMVWVPVPGLWVGSWTRSVGGGGGGGFRHSPFAGAVSGASAVRAGRGRVGLSAGGERPVRVDVSGGQGAQVGDGNTQHNYFVGESAGARAVAAALAAGAGLGGGARAR